MRMVDVGPGCGPAPPLVVDATLVAALPLTPPLVALIVAVPTVTPVTRPLAETVATALLLVVQVTGRSVRKSPAESVSTTESCSVCPTLRLTEAGLTVTEATGGGVIGPTGLSGLS